ncbi:MAG: Hsp20 family protein [Ruminococcus sp.]
MNWMLIFPGFKKKTKYRVQLKDGYLTISAAKGLDKDEQDKKGITTSAASERYAGSSSRSFYVGNGLKNEDVHAKFENGVLRLSLPKKAAEEIEADKYIYY